MTELYIMSIQDGLNIHESNKLLEFVSKERRKRIEGFKYEKDAKRSLYASILVRYLISNKLNMQNDDIQFDYNEFGKPYIHGISNQFFNLSHSGDYVICGWSNQEIGVDIELIEALDTDIGKSCFTPNEYEFLMSNKLDKLNCFFKLWTLKESYVKFKGKGLSIALDSFELNIRNGNDITLNSKERCNPNFFVLNTIADYIISVCTMDYTISGIKTISIHDIWNKYFNNEKEGLNHL